MAYGTLPQDIKGQTIQAMAPDGSGIAQITVGAASARVALPGDCEVVRVASTVDCWFRFGDGSVVAAGTDSFFAKGSEIFKIPSGATHIAAIQTSAGGTMSITRML